MNRTKRAFLAGLLGAIFAVALTPATASEAAQAQQTTPPHGELAATIRSAGLPCAHVISVEAIGSSAWQVKCNSGSARVVRGEDGQLAVANL
jgi:hypothetical protein